jgi:hypothetical protein
VPKLVPILEFAYRIGFTTLYDGQARVLLRYEGGDPVAAACAIGSVSSASPSMSLVIDDSGCRRSEDSPHHNCKDKPTLGRSHS